jgi:hypothetical protein
MNAPSNDIADLLDMPITPSHKSYQAPSGPIDLLSQDYAPITSTSKKLTLDDLMDPFQTSIRSQPTLSSTKTDSVMRAFDLPETSTSSSFRNEGPPAKPAKTWPPNVKSNTNIPMNSSSYSNSSGVDSGVSHDGQSFRGTGSSYGQNKDPFATLYVIPGKK